MNISIYKSLFPTMLAILMACFVMPAQAKVPADVAAKLKAELNPMGSERTGNQEGDLK